MSNTVKIRYLGNKFPKTVELPVPFWSKSQKTGEVTFNDPANPVMDFPAADGGNLAGIGGLFELVSKEADKTLKETHDIRTAAFALETASGEITMETPASGAITNEHGYPVEPQNAEEEEAFKLLNTAGFNFSAFTRAMGGDSKNQTDMKKMRPIAVSILANLNEKKLIMQENREWFFKKK